MRQEVGEAYLVLDRLEGCLVGDVVADDDHVEEGRLQRANGVGVALVLAALARDVPGLAGDGDTVEDHEEGVGLVAVAELLGGGRGLWAVVLVGAEGPVSTRALANCGHWDDRRVNFRLLQECGLSDAVVADEGNLDALLDNARREARDLDHPRWSGHAHAAGGRSQLVHAALLSLGLGVKATSRGHDARQAVAGGGEGAAEFLGGGLGGVGGGAGLQSASWSASYTRKRVHFRSHL